MTTICDGYDLLNDPLPCSWPRHAPWPRSRRHGADPRANLLPPVTDLREVSWRVARSVAVQAWNEGLTGLGDVAAVSGAIGSRMWMPAYRELVPAHG